MKMNKEFSDWLLGKGLSHKTVKSYVYQVDYFRQWLNGLDILLVSYGDLLQYLESKKEVSQQVRMNYLNSLRLYYTYEIEKGNLIENPADQVHLKRIKTKKIPQVLKKEELTALYHTFPIPEKGSKYFHESFERVAKRNKVMVGLLVHQGIKVEELRALQVKDLDLRAGTVFIANSRKGNERKLALASNQMLDLMEYTLQIRPELLQSPTEQLFFGTGKSQAVIQMTRIVTTLKKLNSNVKSLQQIRASVITHWLKQYNLREVQEMAGHRYVSSTEAYLVNDIESLQEDVNKFHPIN